jgi:DNA-binding transcriptional regulator YdaS (Cro superfamily)
MEILKSWLAAERGRSLRLAQHLRVVPSFVNKMASGERPIPFEHGPSIESFTSHAITRQQMFPNDWQRIWPELATDTSPATQPEHLAEAAQGVA